jgi:hypothetical protein
MAARRTAPIYGVLADRTQVRQGTIQKGAIMFQSLLSKRQLYLLILVFIFATAFVGGFEMLGTVPDCFSIYTWGDFAGEIGLLGLIGYLAYCVGKES